MLRSLRDRIETALSPDEWWWAGEILKESTIPFLGALESVLYSGGAYPELRRRVSGGERDDQSLRQIEKAIHLSPGERNDTSSRARRLIVLVSDELRKRGEIPRADISHYAA